MRKLQLQAVASAINLMRSIAKTESAFASVFVPGILGERASKLIATECKTALQLASALETAFSSEIALAGGVDKIISRIKAANDA